MKRVKCCQCNNIFNFNPEHRTKEHMKDIMEDRIGVYCPDCEGSKDIMDALKKQYDSPDPMVKAKPFKPTLDEHLKTTNACAEMVVRPDHYQLWPAKNALNGETYETIDVIKSVLGTTGVIAFCKGNIIKYKIRAGLKGTPEQDIKKSEMYKKYIELLNIKNSS